MRIDELAHVACVILLLQVADSGGVTTQTQTPRRACLQQQDSWYRYGPGKPAWNDPQNWHRLSASDIHKVTSEMLPKAARMLLQQPVVELSTSQVQELAAKPITFPEGKRPFLVRALYFNEGTGRFAAYHSADRLWVEHASLGRGNVPMKRQALVVFLKSKPKEVYVTCSMDA